MFGGNFSAIALRIPAPADGGFSAERMWSIANQPGTFVGAKNPREYHLLPHGARAVAVDALAGNLADNTSDALYFHKDGVTTGIATDIAIMVTDGNLKKTGSVGGNTYYAPTQKVVNAQQALP